MEMSLIGSIIAVLLIVLYVLLYIYTLVKQAKKREWTWFVLTLLFNPVMIIYWIVKLFK